MSDNQKPIIYMDNIKCKIEHLPKGMAGLLYKQFEVPFPNYWFMPRYKSGVWDGKQKFFTRPANVFPTGLLPMVIQTLEENEFEYEIVDKRVDVDKYLLREVPKDYIVCDSKESRQYQIDTINKIITNNVNGIPFMRGVVNIATNGGKTTIAEAILKEIHLLLVNNHKNFLFVTHSKEIALQAKKNFESDLKCPIGFIGDGKWEEEHIIVALIPTLYKRSNKEEFKNLVKNTVGWIGDECLSANSKILIPNNKTMTIKEICEREDITEVVSYNEEKEIFETKKILRKIVTPGTEQFWKIWYTDPLTGEQKGLVATRNHKIWTLNRGYVRVDELTVDDIIKVNTSNPEPWNIENGLYKCHICGELLNHNVKITKISKSIGVVPKFKYNLEVEDNHNYFADNILVSNCHHSSSNTWYETLNKFTNASIRLGLTGTVDKENKINEYKLYSCTGTIINKISNDYLIKNGYSAKPECLLFEVTSPELEGEIYSEAYQLGIVESDERLDLIYQICKKETDSNYNVLILVEHIDHGEFIKEVLKPLEVNKTVVFTNGQLDSDSRTGALDDLRNGKVDVLISTSILDEGVDVSNINAVIYARGMKSTRKLLQGIGRGLRKKSDGSKLRFYDFIDNTHSALLTHSLGRYKTLKSEGFNIKKYNLETYKDIDLGGL